jgi:hypothetical protein
MNVASLLPKLTDTRPGLESSNLYGLFLLSKVLFNCRDEDTILKTAAESFPSIGQISVDSLFVKRRGVLRRASTRQGEGNGAVGKRHGEGRPVVVEGHAWAWAFPLHSGGGSRSDLVLTAEREPSDDELLMIKLLTQQCAAALENAELHRGVTAAARELRESRAERELITRELKQAMSELARRARSYELIIGASTASDVVHAVVTAMHESTGLATVAEDRLGNVMGSAGVSEDDSCPRLSHHDRAELVRWAGHAGGQPVRMSGRLVALVKPARQILGALVLIDPEGTAGTYESFALAHAATVLSTELVHEGSLAEVEARLRRQLVADLITGTDDEDAKPRAAAVGHDLTRSHHVAVASWRGHTTRESFTARVERALSRLGVSALAGWRSGAVVLVIEGEPDGRQLYQAIAREVSSSTGSVGVGSVSETAQGLPRSFDEAMRALVVRRRSRQPDGFTSFDDLGIYRVLPMGSDSEIRPFVNHWLGTLLEYDQKRHSRLVETLAEYLDCGGNYDLAAKALVIHRSTLRYRVRRIRELSRHDLADVEVRLNLHIATRAWRVLDDT